MAGIGVGVGVGGGGGSGLSLNPPKIDSAATGVVAALRTSLKGTLTYSKLSGASAIAIAASGNVTLTGTLGTGSATFVARAQNTSGDAIERSLTLTGVAAGGGAPTPTPTPVPTFMWATNNIRVNNASAFTWSGTKTRCALRTGARLGHFSGQKRLRATFNHWNLTQDAPQEVAATGSYRVVEAFAVYKGSKARVTFGGANDMLVDASKSFFESDDVLPSAFGPYVSFAPDETIEMRCIIEQNTSTKLLSTVLLVNSASSNGCGIPFTGQSWTYDPAVATGYTVDGTVALTAPNGGTAILGTAGGFLGWLGEFETVSARGNSWGIPGDSIAANGIGQFLLGWDAAATVIPGIQFNSSGSEAKDYTDRLPAGNPLRDGLMQHCDSLCIEWAANDFHNSATAQQMVDRVTLVADRAKANGINTVFAMMALPRVTNMPILAGSVSGNTCTLSLPSGMAARMTVGMTMNVNTNANTPASTAYAVEGVAITAISGDTIRYEKPSSPPTAGFTISGAIGNGALYNVEDGFRSSLFMFPDDLAFGPAAVNARETYNGSGLDGLIASGVIYGKIDTTAVQDAVVKWAWKTDGAGGLNGGGTSRLYCGDGTHAGGGGMSLAMRAGYGVLSALVSGSAVILPPSSVTAPAITGTAQVGQTLNTTNGAWIGSPTSYSYQWQESVDGGATWSDISGAVSASYVIASARQGNMLRSSVLAGNSAGASSDRGYSAATSAVAAPSVALPVITTPGSITTDGTPKEGETVTIVAATTTGATSVQYFLRRNDINDTTPISLGSYTLTSSDAVTKLQLRTVATNAGGSVTANSADVGPVAAAAGSTLVSATFANTTTSSVNIVTTPYVSESGHHFTEAGTPDSTTVFGANGNIQIAANNTHEITGSGVQVPVVCTDAVLPNSYRVEVPMFMRTRPAADIRVGAWIRATQTTRAAYFLGLSTGTSLANGRWTIRKSSDDLGSGNPTFTTLIADTVSDGAVAGAYYTIAADSTLMPNGDVKLELFVDLKDGNGYVKKLEYTDPASGAYAAPGKAGWYGSSPMNTTQFTGPKADQQPFRIISK